MKDEVFDDDSVIYFGKYKGRKLINVPADYLIWLYENDKAGRLKDYIEDNIDVLRKEAKE